MIQYTRINSLFGDQEDIENHLWTASGLPCRSVFKGGDMAMQADRWVTWTVVQQCSKASCAKKMIEEMAYPCIRLPTSWSDVKGTVVQMLSVEDAVKRVMLQESAQSGKCRACKTGDTLHSIIPASIQLPTLLVVSLEANRNRVTTQEDMALTMGQMKYKLTGVAFHRPGHYTCTWRLEERWYYYDDLLATKIRAVTGTYNPKGFTRRLMYYVRDTNQNNNFNGDKASKNAQYSMSIDGGVWQQEGTVISKTNT